MQLAHEGHIGSSSAPGTIDVEVYERTVVRLRETGVVLPTFEQLAKPELIPEVIVERLAGVEPDVPNPLNLFRIHWFNAPDRTGRVGVPDHVVLPPELTGVSARIVVALGDRFPMIRAHKLLAAHACLVPRIVSGEFDPTRQRTVWPSTGNYCRGGVAVSRLMGCRGIAVLPKTMSRERFAWLERWVTDPNDIIRTPGVDSRFVEIYGKCAELAADPENVVFNQFSDFAQHLAHYMVTGRAFERIFESMAEREPSLRLRAFVSATGSAGTLAAGDYLKEQTGSLIVALEALECPTMLRNGLGDHNIQGIGDKHIPLIHNVMNTDMVAAVSDRATDTLNVVFNSEVGREFLRRRDVAPAILESLSSFGLSSICNILGAIKVAKYLDLDRDDVVLTVATDGAAMYATEVQKVLARDFPNGFDEAAAAAAFGRYMLGAGTDDMLELSYLERKRIFNLGYFTWVEQQGVSLEDFERRREQSFWRNLRGQIPVWDELIVDMNGRTGVLDGL